MEQELLFDLFPIVELYDFEEKIIQVYNNYSIEKNYLIHL